MTQLKFNREGDLLFSCAKDNHPTLWYSENGQRVGTYNGHNGAVPSCDVTMDSSKLITASADSSTKLWDVMTGECLFTFQFHEPCKAVALSLGDEMAAISTDPFVQRDPTIKIVNIAAERSEQSADVIQTFTGYSGRVNRVHFVDLNKTLISAGEDGFVRRWDVETGKNVESQQLHKGNVMDLQLSKDGTHFITASTDMQAKLVDMVTLETLKTYPFERPCNSAAISPIYDHVLLGGGQDAASVTTTAAKAGGFEARFFHKIFTEEFGSVRGHFGPINTVAFHPDGNGFVTGGEDGYVRLHHFDNDYHATSFF